MPLSLARVGLSDKQWWKNRHAEKQGGKVERLGFPFPLACQCAGPKKTAFRKSRLVPSQKAR
jgi:hypothetical protein